MRHRPSIVQFTLVCSVVAFGVGGCIASTTMQRQRATVRALDVVGVGQEETPSVVILVDPITTANWRDQTDIALHLMFEESDFMSDMPNLSSGVGGSTSGKKGSTTSSGVNGMALQAQTGVRVRDDTVSLVPLPAFRVQFVNRSDKTVELDPSRWVIRDGNGAVGYVLSDDKFVLEAERTIAMRHRNLYEAGERDLLADLRRNLGMLPLFGKKHTLAPGEEYQGFVSFDLYSDKPVQSLAITFDGTRVGEAPDAPIKFAFVSQPRPLRRCPVEGEVASVLGVCPSDGEGYAPAPNGPCIQETRTYNNHLRAQTWIASAPVADSDLYRTLQSQPVPRDMTNRGLKLRALGWAFVGLGIASAMVAVLTLAETGHASQAPWGLTGLAITPVGFGLTYRGQVLIKEGEQRFNELAETSGVCNPVW